jgi:hypothetical protein
VGGDSAHVSQLKRDMGHPAEVETKSVRQKMKDKAFAHKNEIVTTL